MCTPFFIIISFNFSIICYLKFNNYSFDDSSCDDSCGLETKVVTASCNIDPRMFLNIESVFPITSFFAR